MCESGDPGRGTPGPSPKSLLVPCFPYKDVTLTERHRVNASSSPSSQCSNQITLSIPRIEGEARVLARKPFNASRWLVRVERQTPAQAPPAQSHIIDQSNSVATIAIADKERCTGVKGGRGSRVDGLAAHGAADLGSFQAVEYTQLRSAQETFWGLE